MFKYSRSLKKIPEYLYWSKVIHLKMVMTVALIFPKNFQYYVLKIIEENRRFSMRLRHNSTMNTMSYKISTGIRNRICILGNGMGRSISSSHFRSMWFRSSSWQRWTMRKAWKIRCYGKICAMFLTLEQRIILWFYLRTM